MSGVAQHYWSAAAGNITGARRNAERCLRLLHLGGQIDKAPEGFVDLLGDVASLQAALERLQASLDALAEGKELPA